MIVANWDYAGTNKFVSHILLDDEKRTLCGLDMSIRRGEWEEVDIDKPGCLRCRNISNRRKDVKCQMNY